MAHPTLEYKTRRRELTLKVRRPQDIELIRRSLCEFKHHIGNDRLKACGGMRQNGELNSGVTVRTPRVDRRFSGSDPNPNVVYLKSPRVLTSHIDSFTHHRERARLDQQNLV
jgi:hypothetical protein